MFISSQVSFLEGGSFTLLWSILNVMKHPQDKLVSAFIYRTSVVTPYQPISLTLLK